MLKHTRDRHSHHPSPFPRIKQRQYQGAAVPVPTLSSRRLEVALQHIHKGHVSFPVLRASHVTTPGGGINDQAVLRVDYEGVQVRFGLIGMEECVIA